MSEPIFDLTYVWAAIIAFGVIMYVLMDGFDLGQGILFMFAPSEHDRDIMMNSVAPVWDGNETWLVLGGAGLLAAFPLVYSIFLPALYIGVFLLLAGLIFRGVAFEFRFKAHTSRYLWNWAFAIGSTVAAFAQGAVVGAYIQGFETENMRYVGGALDWLSPFTVLTGLGLVAGYALLGATWLVMKSEGSTQQWAYRLVKPLLAAVLLIFAIISIWTPFVDPFVSERWFSHITPIWLLPILALACAFWLYRSIQAKREGTPFIATMGMFIFTYLGLLASKWPYVVPPNYTLSQAASAHESQLFLLLGLLFVIPIVLVYTAWTYWVFRGKVKADQGYH
ncbi:MULTISPECIES: cytochrome d ubiquinol oxidase subunit II [Idiomarina]|jgi:cytochrome d ubiquinol oxidase subunit II|uniref:Quinol oxidase subunit ii transmembrane protein n=1 Tax=Idiomarina baltica OS145 TaxID=314276 RepID=A0ABM9WQ12_9GAMM|nr:MULTISPECIES: cytochrome d ubiquinol oxidase subunit II [Idiomarina]MBL74959.1 cytochrome d ubiquinol oxidase subunit II [Idiomarinaceae bacterium]MEC8926568.1 cytochrome d ubiquinol oxidase subunit II [Pseudomonadota bacterium]EAQ33083.1 putative quinol oxidase subunit ii transmembrane protein [Idiomarina baltica OS145]KXS36267.1 MAG: ubiquinol oxidase subunit II, cyanide insensitive [Idiomarina sp. T82-3]MBR38035.1 cytochrome d ubiquinol oxidase subunit II [Idiomarina sp.]|tara:strand:+ start:1348 stop:2355 length:1008 start_codon:yes stop_codon:yes gene_type:complete